MADTKMKAADRPVVNTAQKERIALFASKLQSIAAQQTRKPLTGIQEPVDTFVASAALRRR